MSGTAAIHCRGAQVVFEGALRVRWRRAAAAEWVPTGVWPSAVEAREVQGRLNRGEPLLVVLSAEPGTVELLAEEFAAAPDAVAALAIDPKADLVTLVIPFLDWLPPDLRERAVAFLEAVADQLASTPRGLLPGVLLEPVDAARPWVRFGWRRCGGVPMDVDAIAEDAFSSIGCVSRDRSQAHAC